MSTRQKSLDQLLVERELFDSRSQAQAAIMAGLVYVSEQKIDKAGTLVAFDAVIEVRGQAPYVSRGGLKLAKALDEFKIDPKDKVCLDIGASTGGFTDCLLQRGAAKVYAVDVGYGQLAWKLRSDPRVVVIERTNARNLNWDEIRKLENAIIRKFDLSVVDVSFISLSKILPVVYDLLGGKGEVVALIKPQFEAGRSEVGRGGIVRDEKVRERVREKVKKEAEGMGYEVLGQTESPITGADGNIEFLLYLSK